MIFLSPPSFPWRSETSCLVQSRISYTHRCYFFSIKPPTQVLISIPSFAFKSSPIYRSIRSICAASDLPVSALNAGRGQRRSLVCALCCSISLLRVSLGTRRSCCMLQKVNIELVLVVTAKAPLWCARALSITATGRLISTPNIWRNEPH